MLVRFILRLGINRRFNKGLIFAIALLGVSAVAFQNCSNVDFSRDYSSEAIAASTIDGSTVYYTNQKIVPVTINEDLVRFTEVRFSTSASMTDSDWMPREAVMYADLKNDYASDGTKDGAKTLFVEFRDPLTDDRKSITLSIFLDTQVPSIKGLDLLAKGPRGKLFAKGDAVQVNWEAGDRPAPSGQQSGLDPDAGFRYGITYTGDCSESSLSTKSDWQSQRTNLSTSWPEADRLKTFYFCLYVKDRAGNVANFLSQPMTNLWQVIAGDNNVGNGGSVFATSVRFGYPLRLAADSKGNIYVEDTFLNTIRKVGLDNTIVGIAGNGLYGNMVAGDALQTPFSPGDMVFDSKDRLYIAGPNAIWRMTPGATGEEAKLTALLTNLKGGVGRFFIDASTDTLYLSRFTNNISKANEAYLYKFSIADLDAKTAPVNFADVSAKAIIAGNGSALDASDALAQAASVPADGSIEYPGAVTTNEVGDVYFATSAAGGGYPYGHHQLRLLKRDENGNLRNYLVANSVYGVHWMQYVRDVDSSGNEVKYLLLGTDGAGLRKFTLGGSLPLASSATKTIDPYPSTDVIHPNRVGGVLAIYDRTASAKKKLNSLIFTESSNSRVTTLDRDGKVIATWGRPTYDPSQLVATEAIVNNPDNVVQTKNGDLVFTEPLSGLIRKVDPSGAISILAGKPNVQLSAGTLTTKFADFTMYGLAYTYGGRFLLGYESTHDKIVLSEGAGGAVRSLDLATRTVSTLSLAPRSNDPESWQVNSIAVSPVDQSVAMHRAIATYTVSGSVIRSYNGSSFVDFVGNGSIGAPTVGVAANMSSVPGNVTTSAFDSKGNFYFSAGGIYRVDAATKMISKISNYSFNTMSIIENATTSHIIGLNTQAIYDLKVPTAPTLAVPTLMCLPGTFLNRPGQVTIGNDGNLLIADTRNDRIMKYFVRNQSNELTLFDDSCSKVIEP